MDYKHIGLTIKHLRKVRGLTQKELAAKIGTTWEMVSRYETGKSSPLGRIDQIAQALETPVHKILSDNIVEEPALTYNRNTIPLLDKPFGNLEKAVARTKSYYVAPDWIINKYLKVFAVDTGTVAVKTTQIQGDGVIYISTGKPGTETDVALFETDEGFVIANQSTMPSSAKLLGTVIAWEKRFA